MNKGALVASVCAAAAWTGGCLIEARPPPAPYEIAVAQPPPPPVVEVAPRLARPRALWIGGYWHWTGLQYAWIPGHWEAAPAGARWRPARYLFRDGVYFYQPGGWVRR